MNALRKTLACCFAVIACIIVGIIIGDFPRTIRAYDAYDRAKAMSLAWYIPFARRELITAAIFDLIAALAVALFTTAAWTCFASKRSARYWGIAASLLLLLFAAPGFKIRGLEEASWILLALGISGIVAFIVYRPIGKAPALTSIPGDGTHVLLDKLAWIGSAAVSYAMFAWLSQWGHSHGLADDRSLVFYGELFLISILAIAVHEGGHALAAKALDMKLLCLFIGPFGWRLHHGKWRFTFRIRSLLALLVFLSGFTQAAPVTLENFRKRKLLQIAAGPFANFLTGCAAAGALVTAPGHAWQHYWDGLAIFSTLSFLGFLFSFIPYRIKSGYSDGAKIYQLLSDGLWADYHRAISAVYSSLICPRRPRDFDITTLQRVVGRIVYGGEALMVHLFAYSYHLDRGELGESARALARAESVYESTRINLDRSGHIPFIFGNALLNRNPAATRLWWDRMEAKKSETPEGDRWVAFTAFLWMEGRLDEAREALEKACAWAQQLPDVGAYDAERDFLALLGNTLHKAMAEVARQSLDSDIANTIPSAI